MTKVFCVHEIELKPGVDEEEFRKFVNEEMLPLFAVIPVDAYLAKGDKGKRTGRYVWILATDLQTRDELFGAPDKPHPTDVLDDEQMRVRDKFYSMIDPSFTDYIVQFSSK